MSDFVSFICYFSSSLFLCVSLLKHLFCSLYSAFLSLGFFCFSNELINCRQKLFFSPLIFDVIIHVRLNCIQFHPPCSFSDKLSLTHRIFVKSFPMIAFKNLLIPLMWPLVTIMRVFKKKNDIIFNSKCPSCHPQPALF